MIFIAEGEMTEEAMAQINSITKEWTTSCARMKGMWTCSDCGMTYNEGMPMECYHKYDGCDRIILRDKKEAGMPWE